MNQRLSLNLRVSQKQILTPGLVQMVSVLALNRLELRDMITQEMVENPILEETPEGELEGESTVSVEELAAAEQRAAADREVTEAQGEAVSELPFEDSDLPPRELGTKPDAPLESHTDSPLESLDVPAKESFDEIDLGSFFDDYLSPGYRSPVRQDIQRPSFENFPSTLRF